MSNGTEDAARAIVETALGPFMVEATARGLRSVTPVPGGGAAARPREHAPIEHANVTTRSAAAAHVREGCAYLSRYAGGDGARYEGALDLAGPPLHLAVWTFMRPIPFGATATYGEIAAALGMPGEARAIGGAVAANPLCVVVPCHRVVGADGSLRGFAWGLDLKRQLLAHEGSAAMSLF